MIWIFTEGEGDGIEVMLLIKVKNIQEDILDLMPSPLPSVKVQIMGGQVCLRHKCKTFFTEGEGDGIESGNFESRLSS